MLQKNYRGLNIELYLFPSDGYLGFIRGEISPSELAIDHCFAFVASKDEGYRKGMELIDKHLAGEIRLTHLLKKRFPEVDWAVELSEQQPSELEKNWW